MAISISHYKCGSHERVMLGLIHLNWLVRWKVFVQGAWEPQVSCQLSWTAEGIKICDGSIRISCHRRIYVLQQSG